MKRLLTCLFLVLGLGLAFNVNAAEKYYGVICAKTNKHSWEPNKKTYYEQIYIFNSNTRCSSIGYNIEQITYDFFNKIKNNPQIYSRGGYNDLRKKLRNKICLLPNGKINNLSNKCEEPEKELYISEKSSGKGIILLTKNYKEFGRQQIPSLAGDSNKV